MANSPQSQFNLTLVLNILALEFLTLELLKVPLYFLALNSLLIQI